MKTHSYRAHPTSYLTGGLQAVMLTIPCATAHCPPMRGNSSITTNDNKH